MTFKLLRAARKSVEEANKIFNGRLSEEIGTDELRKSLKFSLYKNKLNSYAAITKQGLVF